MDLKYTDLISFIVHKLWICHLNIIQSSITDHNQLKSAYNDFSIFFTFKSVFKFRFHFPVSRNFQRQEIESTAVELLSSIFGSALLGISILSVFQNSDFAIHSTSIPESTITDFPTPTARIFNSSELRYLNELRLND